MTPLAKLCDACMHVHTNNYAVCILRYLIILIWQCHITSHPTISVASYLRILPQSLNNTAVEDHAIAFI